MEPTIEAGWALTMRIVAAYQRTYPNVDPNEFESDGMLLLWSAVTRFDPSKGSFRSYLITRLKYGLRDVLKRELATRSPRKEPLRQTYSLSVAPPDWDGDWDSDESFRAESNLGNPERDVINVEQLHEAWIAAIGHGDSRSRPPADRLRAIRAWLANHDHPGEMAIERLAEEWGCHPSNVFQVATTGLRRARAARGAA